MRLQRAALGLRVASDAEVEVLNIAGLRRDLSGGTRLELDADIRGADLTAVSPPSGFVTRARLVWRNDGRLMRPVMDLAGEAWADAIGSGAVDATRVALARLVEALPADAIDEASLRALEEFVRSLPKGRGKLTLIFVSAGGIGAARLAVTALADDPPSRDALGTLMDGATITATWRPRLSP